MFRSHGPQISYILVQIVLASVWKTREQRGLSRIIGQDREDHEKLDHNKREERLNLELKFGVHCDCNHIILEICMNVF